MASHVNVGISPKADIELAETLLELLRSGHRLSKRQLTTVAIHRFVQEVLAVNAESAPRKRPGAEACKLFHL